MTTGQPDLLEVIDEMAERYKPLMPYDHVVVDVTDKGTVVTRKLGEAQ